MPNAKKKKEDILGKKIESQSGKGKFKKKIVIINECITLETTAYYISAYNKFGENSLKPYQW